MFQLIEGKYLLLFSHYGGKNVSGQHRTALFCFPNELKNPLRSQLYLQYLCYSAPEAPYGAVSKTQDRRQIKLYFFGVSCSCGDESETHLTNKPEAPSGSHSGVLQTLTLTLMCRKASGQAQDFSPHPISYLYFLV